MFAGTIMLVTDRNGAAGVAELADALDLGSSDENHGGSNPPARTNAWKRGQKAMPMPVAFADSRRIAARRRAAWK
jgi:hypothetical protein